MHYRESENLDQLTHCSTGNWFCKNMTEVEIDNEIRRINATK